MDSEKFFDSIKESAEKIAKALFGDRSWPDAAFVVEKGAEKDDQGKTLQKYRHLPHHSKGVKSATEHTTVDLPHLRNALARVNQVKPVKESGAGFRKRASAHLNRHANALLKTRKGKADYEEIQALCKEYSIIEEEE